ncbi:MAG: hypothetical protein ACPLX7_04890 [Candidatus Kapaibacteriota bacterium]|jgi:dihydroorotate dehydrogenase
MTTCETISKIDLFFRPFLVENYPGFATAFYSYGRKLFLNRLIREKPAQVSLPQELHRTFWGIKFNSPIFNAAGMFKDGNGYGLACLQAAGAFLAGTITPKPRKGNFKKWILHPFIPYPRSRSSSNWMGLPNPGFKKVIDILNRIHKQNYVPIGISLASNGNGFSDLEELCEVLHEVEKSNVDFVEVNESCPNIEHGKVNLARLDSNFLNRIELISDKFLKKRKRNLPVILKLSNDFEPESVPLLLDALLDLGFDGVNFGNTSTNYDECRKFINSNEVKAYYYFTKLFGGGVSGLPLKHKSFTLTQNAMKHLQSKKLNREFYVIRTGGIYDYEDYQKSSNIGISIFQWFTGYFENFIKYGHKLYQKFFRV